MVQFARWDKVEKVAFCVGGHLGDAINALYVISAFNDLYPHIEIYVVCPSWVVPAFRGVRAPIHLISRSPLVGNRSGESSALRFWKAVRSYLGACITLRRMKVDVGVDLYWYWPNSSVLLWLSGVKIRHGYRSGGAGQLYTYSLNWQDLGWQVVDYMRNVVGPDGDPVDTLATTIWCDDSRSEEIPAFGRECRERRYIVIHPGSGDSRKRWIDGGWVSLIDWCESAGLHVVLTGHGKGETELCQGLAADRREVSNLAGRLKFEQYRRVIRDSIAFVGVDSVGGHIAGVYGVPSLLLYTGITSIELWRPYGVSSRTLRHSLDCVPCLLSKGCESMNCIRMISPQVVVAELAAMIRTAESRN